MGEKVKLKHYKTTAATKFIEKKAKAMHQMQKQYQDKHLNGHYSTWTKEADVDKPRAQHWLRSAGLKVLVAALEVIAKYSNIKIKGINGSPCIKSVHKTTHKYSPYLKKDFICKIRVIFGVWFSFSLNNAQ